MKISYKHLACVSLVSLMALACGSDDDDDGGGAEAGAGGTSSAAGAPGQAGSMAGSEEDGAAGAAGDEDPGTAGAAGSGTAGAAGDEDSGMAGMAGMGTAGMAGMGTAGMAGMGTAGMAGMGTAGMAGMGTAGSAGEATAGAGGEMAQGGSMAQAGAGGAPPVAASDLAQIEGADFTEGDAPEESGDAEAPTVTPPETVINGGTGTYTVTVPDGAIAILVEIEGDSGYYTVPVTSETGTQDVDVTLLQGFEGDSVEVGFATINEEGEVSAWVKHPVDVVQTQGGEIKVSLSFVENEELDLAVIDPNGDPVYYNNTPSESGGVLDLDTNRLCVLDGINNENVYWSEEDALEGEYIVIVSWYEQCSEDTTAVEATVTITVGEDVRTESVILTTDDICPDEGCGAEQLIEVARFTY